MQVARWSLAALVASLSAGIPHCRAAAQGSIVDRAKKSMGDAANAAKKGLSDETSRQINSAVNDAADQEVADGAFNAAISPWTSSDGTKRVELARFTGSAFVVTTSVGRQLVFCDDKGVLPWLASLTIANSAAAAGGASKSGGGGASKSGGGGASKSADGAKSTGATSGGVKPSSGTTSVASGEVVQSGTGGLSLPTMAGREYRLPSSGIAVVLPSNGANAGSPSLGSLKVGDVSESIFSGAAKMRFAQATLPGSAGKQTVDYGVVFKARVLADGQTPGQCLTAGSSKGAAPTKAGSTGTAAPSPPGGAAPAAAATTGALGFVEGDMVSPKIGNVKLVAGAKDDAKVVATLNKGDELVYLGQEQNGYVHVQGSSGDGWVKKVLISKR